MTAIIKTERLTKSYGEHRGITELDLEVQTARSSDSSGPTAPARRPRCGCCSTSSVRRGRAEVFGIGTTPIRTRSADGSATCRPNSTCTTPVDGRQTFEFFGDLRGEVDKAYVAAPGRAVRARYAPAVQGV